MKRFLHFFMLLMLVAFAASTLTSCEEVDEEMNTPNELTGTDESDESDESEESDELDDSEESDELDDSEESDELDDSEESDELYDSEESDEVVIPDGYTPIYTAAQLASIGVSDDYPLDGNYIMMNNISLEDYDNWEPIGSEADSFTGTFDGGDYTISDLTINNEEEGYYHQGLFGYIDGGAISNLVIKDPQINGFRYVGALCGYLYSGSIESCGVEGGAVSGSYHVGGVVGRAISSDSSMTITSCYNTGAVSGSTSTIGGVCGSFGSSYSSVTITSCYNTGTVSGGYDRVGGVVGVASSYSSVTITSCYNTGDVEGYSLVGGVVGESYSFVTITSCYNTGAVLGSTSEAGGVVGYVSSSPVTITACYFIDQVGDDADYGVGNSTSSSYTYMKLSSVSELNAVVTTMNSAAGDTYFTAGSPSTTHLPYLFDENLEY